MIRAIAPDVKIYLFLADSDLFPDLFDAVDAAVDRLVGDHGGGVVSDLRQPERRARPGLDQFDLLPAPQSAQVSFVAGSGDVAATASYPSTSPFVIGVGGTALELDGNGLPTGTETPGTAAAAAVGIFPAPTTSRASCTGVFRSTPDVAYNADPFSGIAVFSAPLRRHRRRPDRRQRLDPRRRRRHQRRPRSGPA